MNEIRKTNRNNIIRMVVFITILFAGSLQVFAQDKNCKLSDQQVLGRGE